MRSIIKIISFLVAFVFVALTSFSQDTPRKAPAGVTPAAPQAPANTNDDFDSRMAKLQQAVSKLETKASKAKDPQMKADLEAMISKMKSVTDEYNAMKSNPSLTEQQQQQERKKIHDEMEVVRKMHDDMKAKYGVETKRDKQNQQQQPAGDQPPQKAQPAEPK